MKSGLLLAAAIAAVCWRASPAVAEEGAGCAVPDDLMVVNYPLDHVYDKLKAKEPVRIVIVGSTSSSAASRAGQSGFRPFPRFLEGELAHGLPEASFPLDIKVAPGVTAPMVAARLDKEVIPARPDLVIWETGTTDAVKEVDVNEFGDAITAGLRKLHERGIDVVLVDIQYSPQTSALYNFQPYLDYLWRIGEAETTNVLRRYEIMRSYVEDGRFVPGTTTPADQMRNANFVHACLARQLAKLILTAAQQP